MPLLLKAAKDGWHRLVFSLNAIRRKKFSRRQCHRVMNESFYRYSLWKPQSDKVQPTETYNPDHKLSSIYFLFSWPSPIIRLLFPASARLCETYRFVEPHRPHCHQVCGVAANHLKGSPAPPPPEVWKLERRKKVDVQKWKRRSFISSTNRQLIHQEPSFDFIWITLWNHKNPTLLLCVEGALFNLINLIQAVERCR